AVDAPRRQRGRGRRGRGSRPVRLFRVARGRSAGTRGAWVSLPLWNRHPAELPEVPLALLHGRAGGDRRPTRGRTGRGLEKRRPDAAVGAVR
ncbi:unnamed protein product, partial [Ectocarpus fasciculatus]